MKKSMIPFLVAVLFSFSQAMAQDSPIGKWRTIDDETKQEKSIVEIYEANGKLYGRILRLIQEKDGGAGKLCTECPGSDKNKPMLGLVIIRDLVRKGDEYAGGTILDPKKGKVYNCKLRVIEGGEKLEVRGFIGLSLIGRTQLWYRVR
ncbi:MAG: DUF2147 domain-containing protein [Syntrophales bacterium]|nr:DUF2147 domain-containing protein [Syntrophales bacterium]